MEKRTLRSGELARLAGVSTDLLRHYERIGIVRSPLRAANGYRRYSVETLDRVRAARRALSIGFSLSELARIFAVRDRGGVPCQNVRALAQQKLRRVEESLVELRVLRMQLRKILLDWDHRLGRTPAGRPAGLLHSLETALPDNHRPQRTKKGFSGK